MKLARRRAILVALIFVLTVGGWAVDLNTPLGVSDWVGYFIALILSVFVGARVLPFQLAAGFSMMMLVGFFLKPSGINPHLALLSRLTGVGVMWVVAFVIWLRKGADHERLILSRAVEQSPAAVVITNKDGNIEYVNPKFTALTGYSCQEVIGSNPRILKSGETAPAEYKGLWETISAGREWRGEFHNRKKNGELFWEMASITPILNMSGKITHYLAVKEDITDRKRAEQKLNEAFNFEQKIISNASVGIIVYKASGGCLLANEAAARIINATIPQLLKQNFRTIASWHSSGMLAAAEDALAKGESREIEPHFISTFGQEVWLVCHFTPFIQNGEAHLLFIFTDVTEKKKLEAQLLRAQRMESIGTLAGGIAHDLNNVLTPLLLAVQILKEKTQDADSQKILGTLEANVYRGARLVKQVLAFGRGVRGDSITVQPKIICEGIKRIINETFPKSIVFEFQSPDDLWTVTGDPTQIEQVLLNLCVNARDAMPEGGKLSIKMENIVLDEVYAFGHLGAKPGRYVVISVMDTGEGMTKEIQDRIFEPFFTTKPSGKGTGLGLSTTLGIIKSHGGFINCYSELGRGTLFKIYLPATVNAAKIALARETAPLPLGNNELVLIVDDEEPVRILAQKTLEKYGYRVLVAADGTQAINLFNSHRDEIAVVITDMAMPIMDGLATIKALKAINPNVKLVSSSGLDLDSRIAMTKNDDVRHFIPKPYTAEAMLKVLHEVVQGPPKGPSTTN